jgi:hypothetical protein
MSWRGSQILSRSSQRLYLEISLRSYGKGLVLKPPSLELQFTKFLRPFNMLGKPKRLEGV